MKTVYIDPTDFKCHVTDDGTRIPYETEFFSDKCDAFVEGYRVIPEGYIWKRSDGVVFHGEMIAPWKPYQELAAAQQQYEAMLPEILDMRQALSTMGVSIDG